MSTVRVVPEPSAPVHLALRAGGIACDANYPALHSTSHRGSVTCRACVAITGPSTEPQRWWKYAVIRGEGIPAHLDGTWYDLDDLQNHGMLVRRGREAFMEPTNQWEQRDDGEVAVVYRWRRL
jgi:hypothetical protein